MQIYYGSLGRDSNNAAELEGLWNGIFLAEKENLFPLEVEGDSQILIEAAIRIQFGTPATKIASSWRLFGRLEQIEEWLSVPHTITFKHIRHTANRVADRLANQGVNQQLPIFSGPLHSSDDAQLIQDCTLLVQQDLHLLDAGV